MKIWNVHHLHRISERVPPWVPRWFARLSSLVPLPRPAFRLSSRLHLVIMNAGITIVGSQGPKGETHQSQMVIKNGMMSNIIKHH